MKIYLFCALIFFLKTALAEVTIKPHYQSEVNQAVTFQLKKPLVLSCTISSDAELDTTKVGIDWKFEGKSVGDISTLENRFKLTNAGLDFTLTISDGKINEVGNWSCEALVDGTKYSADIHVVTTIAVKIKTENINVVEEEKLRIECSVLGTPPPDLFWIIETNNYENGTVFNQSEGRVKIEDYKDDTERVIKNGVLIIEKIDKGDRGLYYCNATNKFWSGNTEISHSMIRVKDKYAALWPFLGICAEVIVLCAVIIIYEKKRNKTELEESDTDQSPDQKNTPDHGKEANLRHRQ